MKKIVGTIGPFVPSFIKRPLKKRLYPDWHKGLVGGDWEEIGQLQFDFWLKQGLKPEHFFLDVGCGALRAGIHFVRYLETGHYFGIDNNKKALDAGRQVELLKHGLTHKNPTLVHMDDFNFQSLGAEFDYATIHSVFPHLALNSVIKCIMNIEKVLVPGGQCYATFYENPQGKFNLGPIVRSHVTTYFDKPLFHYDFGTFESICEGTNLKVEYIGAWDHPRGQMIMVFTKSQN
jgi:SAM-dependent methyltransferase